MTRFTFMIAFLLGALSIAWMGWVFAGSDSLALTVTALIGCVYLIGFVELISYRQATGSLTHGLCRIPKQMNSLNEWLHKLDPSLQTTVGLRIEGERVGLPTPVLTPYLVGLLVMLGLMGTFLGLVDTLKGAVIALEGTSDLQAIRAGLAAPMRGLSFAFGTSVAGVSASAMLGLMSTLCKRERLHTAQILDSKISQEFRQFSVSFQRHAAYEAVQRQAKAIPELTETIHRMSQQFEQHLGTLSESLISNQENFNTNTKASYAALAQSVDKTLRGTVTDTGQLAAERIKPIVEQVMSSIRTESQNTHQHLTEALQKQFEDLSNNFANTSKSFANTWQAGLDAQEASTKELVEGLDRSHNRFTEHFKGLSTALVKTFEHTAAALSAQHTKSDQEKLNLWLGKLEEAQTLSSNHLTQTAKVLSDEFTRITKTQETTVNALVLDFQTMATQLTSQLEEAGATAITQQKITSDALEKSTEALSSTIKDTASSLMNDVNRLIEANDALAAARIDTEASWIAAHDARMADLTHTMTLQLEALRTDEAKRGQVALAQLSDLEAKVAQHLGSLGQALEAPMTRLIETASETPRAAAEVIEQLRQEISNNIARDNAQLEERRNIMAELLTLSNALTESAQGQQRVIETLMQSTTETLENIGSAFQTQVNTETSKLSEVADHFATSAIELASFGEGFSLAINLFNDSNANLVENLNRIEQALNESTLRSDEQVGYYVAQAREIIDYSLLSQKELIDTLTHLRQKDNVLEAEVDS